MEVTIKKRYEVTMKKVIQEGSFFRIHHSDGFCGIEDGIVKVINIGSREDMNDPSHDFESWEVNGKYPEHYVQYEYKFSGGQDILPLDVFINHITSV